MITRVERWRDIEIYLLVRGSLYTYRYDQVHTLVYFDAAKIKRLGRTRPCATRRPLFGYPCQVPHSSRLRRVVQSYIHQITCSLMRSSRLSCIELRGEVESAGGETEA